MRFDYSPDNGGLMTQGTYLLLGSSPVYLSESYPSFSEKISSTLA